MARFFWEYFSVLTIHLNFHHPSEKFYDVVVWLRNEFYAKVRSLIGTPLTRCVPSCASSDFRLVMCTIQGLCDKVIATFYNCFSNDFYVFDEVMGYQFCKYVGVCRTLSYQIEFKWQKECTIVILNIVIYIYRSSFWFIIMNTCELRHTCWLNYHFELSGPKRIFKSCSLEQISFRKITKNSLVFFKVTLIFFFMLWKMVVILFGHEVPGTSIPIINSEISNIH